MASPLSLEDIRELVTSELLDQLQKHQRELFANLTGRAPGLAEASTRPEGGAPTEDAETLEAKPPPAILDGLEAIYTKLSRLEDRMDEREYDEYDDDDGYKIGDDNYRLRTVKAPKFIKLFDRRMEPVYQDISKVRSELGLYQRELMQQFSALRSEAKANRDEVKSLRAEVAQLRQESLETPRYAAFGKLPPEIRCAIWALALPSAEVKVILEDDKQGHRAPAVVAWSYATRRPPPAVAHVSREARAIACRTGRMVPVGGCARDAESGPEEFLFAQQWGWFDPRRDTVTLDIRSRTLHPPFQTIPTLAYHTERIVLSMENAGATLLLEHVFSPRLFPNLRNIDCRARPRTLMPAPVAGAMLFRGKSEITIDLDRIDDFPPLEQGFPGRLRFEELLDAIRNTYTTNIDLEGMMPRGVGWTQYLSFVHKQWLRVQYLSFPLGGTEGYKLFGARLPGCSQRWRDSLRRSPGFRRIVEFSRAEFPKREIEPVVLGEEGDDGSAYVFYTDFGESEGEEEGEDDDQDDGMDDDGLDNDEDDGLDEDEDGDLDDVGSEMSGLMDEEP